MVSPQTEQWEPSVKPVLVQVAATAGSVTSVWSVVLIVKADPIAPQILQTCSLRPFSVQVAA
jgi:hypothetical protein